MTTPLSSLLLATTAAHLFGASTPLGVTATVIRPPNIEVESAPAPSSRIVLSNIEDVAVTVDGGTLERLSADRAIITADRDGLVTIVVAY